MATPFCAKNHPHQYGEKNNQSDAPFFQYLNVCLKTDGCKEKHHADIFECIVICKFDDIEKVQYEHNKRVNHSAHNRRGNAEFLQYRDFLFKPRSEKEDHDGYAQCLIHIQRYGYHASSLLILTSENKSVAFFSAFFYRNTE